MIQSNTVLLFISPLIHRDEIMQLFSETVTVSVCVGPSPEVGNQHVGLLFSPGSGTDIVLNKEQFQEKSRWTKGSNALFQLKETRGTVRRSARKLFIFLCFYGY